MDNTATQLMPEYTGYDDEVGVGESRPNNRIYVNTRCGDIAETSNTEREGFTPEKTVNQAGTVYNFFAKKYPHLTGHIVDIQWHSHTLKNGTVLTGWNLFIDVGQPKIYVLGVGTNDPTYSRTLATLPAIDFLKPVRIVGFMGESQRTHQPQKVLLFSQEKNAENKPVWLQPKLEAKWLSRVIIDKLKHGDALTEQEEKRVSRTNDGKFNKDYPYIVQKPDGKWSFDTWEGFLYEQMKEFVIPTVQDACRIRGYSGPITAESHEPRMELPADVANAPVYNDPNDDIPF